MIGLPNKVPTVGRSFTCTDVWMRNLLPILIPAMLLGACNSQENARNGGSSATIDARPSGSMKDDATNRQDARWTDQSTVEGAALVLNAQTNFTILSLSCPRAANRLQINVRGFAPIGSEERLSFGSDGEVEALVADVRGDKKLGGVSATGAVPQNLAGLLGGRVIASYGSQTSGPHPAVPRDVAGSFVAACHKVAPIRMPQTGSSDHSVSPCFVQDGQQLSTRPLRAVGTEPFWGARIEGRCVTYLHPEDQQGTRVWTRFTATSQGGLWSGALGGRQFELRTHAAPGCSDGMSEKIYPVAVELLVHGERRKGCAEPM